jgi:hypothetical protein
MIKQRKAHSVTYKQIKSRFFLVVVIKPWC